LGAPRSSASRWATWSSSRWRGPTASTSATTTSSCTHRPRSPTSPERTRLRDRADCSRSAGERAACGWFAGGEAAQGGVQEEVESGGGGPEGVLRGGQPVDDRDAEDIPALFGHLGCGAGGGEGRDHTVAEPAERRGVVPVRPGGSGGIPGDGEEFVVHRPGQP